MKKIIFTTVLLAFLQILSISVNAQSLVISTIAGNGNEGYSGDGGLATAAKLRLPYGITVDDSGNIYFADMFNYRIRKINTSGIITTIAGNGTEGFSGDGGLATAAELNSPQGVTVDSVGNIYIADWGNNRIRKINTSGIITTIAGDSIQGYNGDGGAATSAELYYPSTVILDAAGNLLIVDQGNYRIRKVNTSGIITTVAGNGVYGYGGDGGLATAAELKDPTGVAVDLAGNIYITDQSNFRIRKINTSGIISTVAGNGTPGYSGDGGVATTAEISNTIGLAADPAGSIYFADGGNSRIRKINTSGIITTIAGNGTAGFSGDGGISTSAELKAPSGITLDAAGNFYFSDENNNRIRELSVTTSVPENNFPAASINVFPNPSNGIFNFVPENNFQKSSLEIYNVLGEKIISTTLTASQKQINLSEKAKGIYFYKVISEDGKNISEGKIILQ